MNTRSVPELTPSSRPRGAAAAALVLRRSGPCTHSAPARAVRFISPARERRERFRCTDVAFLLYCTGQNQRLGPLSLLREFQRAAVLTVPRFATAFHAETQRNRENGARFSRPRETSFSCSL